jgi:hypothetical protein
MAFQPCQRPAMGLHRSAFRAAPMLMFSAFLMEEA